MPDRPQRPLRPDEEEELARFHNGDTLGNLPVVQSSPARADGRSVPRSVVLVACVGVLGGLAGAVFAHLTQGNEKSAGAPIITTSPRAPQAQGGAPSASSVSSPSPPVPETPSLNSGARPTLEQVRIIQTPPTGGDPSSTYCLVYTGSSSGAEREAILLMNAPGYQCQDLLPYDGTNSAFSTAAPSCRAPSRAAVLSFAETGGWEGELMYTCLTENHGA
ncbi:hypothetical protein JK359_28455 [Streptomyces actinomycinicus]|uniref:Uncharacterized protein n=1 Tax=Streptomyces actinomycinicus TaxID=1695166 RepID=A0A937EM85_9ACTN|nr:hypothetical protein [Streptomyces actinomycinicus]MBL1085852.1 hypothetical protein [Streptomyces actinomycinicus]